MTAFSRRLKRTARKDHQCAGCHCVIRKGRRYVEFAGLCGESGSFYCERMCYVCARANTRLWWRIHPDDMLYETLVDEWQAMADSCPDDREAVAIAAVLKRRIERNEES